MKNSLKKLLTSPMLLPLLFIVPLTGELQALGAEGIVFAVTLLLFISSLIGIIIKKLKLPFTVILVLIGIALGSISQIELIKDNHEHWFCHILSTVGDLRISHEVILFVFLPTLIFEASFNMDVKKLTQNLFPILVMAIPILLISTFSIGAILYFAIDMDFKYAILFGGLISATDPVAVIALFKELGAPKRLTILMEGESLFNDGTAIVLFSIIMGIIISGQEATTSNILNGIGKFLIVFLGGIGTGLTLGFIFAKIIQSVKDNPMIETVLTTVLAYLSFMVAEHYLGVSGVMATVFAGLVMSSYGRTKISPKVEHFMHEYWEFAAYIFNSLIFLLVGLALTPAIISLAKVDITVISVGPVIAIIITFFAIIFSRAVGIYSILPSLHKLKLSEQISPKYTFIMFWGGLRGAIALALALMLLYNENIPNKNYANLIFVMTSMIVLLSLLVNATTIKYVLKIFKLDQLSPYDLFLKNQSMKQIHSQIHNETTALEKEGLFSNEVLKKLDTLFAEQINTLIDENIELTEKEEKSVLLQICLRLEKSYLWQNFQKNRISEHVYKKYVYQLEEEEDAIVYDYEFFKRKELLDMEDPTPFIRGISEFFRKRGMFKNFIQRHNVNRIKNTYGAVRAKFIATNFIITQFLTDELAKTYANDVFLSVKKEYQSRHEEAVKALELLSKTFPEYVDKIQTLLAFTIQLNQEEKILEESAELGIITDKIKNILLEKITSQLVSITKEPITELLPDPLKLIEKIPFFAPLSDEERINVATLFKTESYPKGGIIFKEGEYGTSMYIIARGKVNIIQKRGDIIEFEEGNFFGELALILETPRTATAMTALPSILLELNKNDLQTLLKSKPEIGQIIRETGKTRFKEIKDKEANRLFDK